MSAFALVDAKQAGNNRSRRQADAGTGSAKQRVAEA